MTLAARSTQIEIDDRGIAWIACANTKVLEVVQDKIAHGWTVEEMHAHHPHLSLAQIYEALAYYYENQAAVDQQIAELSERSADLERKLGDSMLRRKLIQTKLSR